MIDITKLTLKTKAAGLIAVVLVLVIGSTTFIFSSEVNSRLETALLASTALVGENLVSEIKETVDMGIYLSELDGLGGHISVAVERNTTL